MDQHRIKRREVREFSDELEELKQLRPVTVRLSADDQFIERVASPGHTPLSGRMRDGGFIARE